jgi:cobalt-zinc-cadmium efflux system protein
MLALPPVTADKQFENLTAAPQRLMILSGCSACMSCWFHQRHAAQALRRRKRPIQVEDARGRRVERRCFHVQHLVKGATVVRETAVQAQERHHDHEHRHGAGHVHAPASFGMAFAIGIGLNVTFVAVEFVFGVLANSVSLLADAGHNLSDVVGLVIAWIASVLVKRPPSSRYTYGLRSSSILAALFNAVFLLVAVGAIAWEAILRLFHPEPVATGTVMIVAAVGILINGGTAWLFASGRKGDLNIRGAFLHMIADAAVSAGVVVAGLVILFTGWVWLDPLTSLVIVGVIMWGTWGLLRDSLAMSVNAVPSTIDPQAVRRYLETCAGVSAVHDLHIWSMSTTESALTAHLVFPAGHPGDGFLMRAATELRHRFGIGHTTLQIEISEESACHLAPDDVV